MPYPEPAGSGAVLEHLRPAAARGALSHAYIISGEAGSGRYGLARYIAAMALCEGGAPPCGDCRHCRKILAGTHPDVITLTREKDKRDIPVESIRALRADAAVLPNEAAKKVYIIREAGAMNGAAQNALLKVLEEPPAHVMFILVAGTPGELLDTIRSRSVELMTMPPETESAVGDGPAARVFSALCAGSELEAACAALAVEKLERTELPVFANDLRRLAAAGITAGARGKALCPLGPGALFALTELADSIERYCAVNVSVGHIAGLTAAALRDIMHQRTK